MTVTTARIIPVMRKSMAGCHESAGTRRRHETFISPPGIRP